MQRATTFARRYLTPWIWVPVMWALSAGADVTETLHVSAPLVVLPLAGYLGHTYGRYALFVVAIGGLSLLPEVRINYVSIGGSVDLLVLAMFICLLGAREVSWREALPTVHPTRWFHAGLLLLPLAVSWYGRDVGDARIAMVTRLETAYYLLLFLAGTSQLRWGPIASVLAAGCAIGIGLDAFGPAGQADQWLGGARADVPLLGLVELRALWIDYSLNCPAMLLSGLWYFASGLLFICMLESPSSIVRPRWAAIVLLLLVAVMGAGWGINDVFARSLPGAHVAGYWRVCGDYYAIPLAALLGGLLLRRIGVVLVLAVVVVFAFVNPLLAHPGLALGDFPPQGNPGDVLQIVVFGWVGLRMRQGARGEEAPDRPWRWCLFAALTFVALSESLLPEEPETIADFLPLGAAFLVVMSIAGAIAWSRHRHGRMAHDHAGWIAILALIALAQTFWDHFEEFSSAVQKLFAAGSLAAILTEEGPLVVLALVAGLAIYLWVLLTAIRTTLRNATACYGDVLRVVRMIALWAGWQQLVAKITRLIPEAPPAGEEIPIPRWRVRLMHIIAQVRNAVGAVVVVVATVVVVPTLWRGMDWSELFPSSTSDEEPEPDEAEAPRKPEMDLPSWEAALTQVAYHRLKATNPWSIPATIQTQWEAEPDSPDIRRSLTINVWTSSGFSSPVSVTVRRQRYWALGVWIEGIDELDELSRAEAEKLKEDIAKRAAELAGAVSEGAAQEPAAVPP